MVFDDGSPEAELGDPPVGKGLRARYRWTVGRIATLLAMILIAVPIGIDVLEPQVRGPGACGNTPENFALVLGLFLIAARTSWFLLKSLNDAFERACDYYWPTPSRPRRKPKPLEDLRRP